MEPYGGNNRDRTPENANDAVATPEPTAKTANKTSRSARKSPTRRSPGSTDTAGTERRPNPPATFGAVKLADLLIPRITGRFRYCKGLGGWLVYDGARWVEDADDLVLAECVATVKDYALHVINNGGLNREAATELGLFSSGSCQSHAVKIARSAPNVRTLADDFDAYPGLDEPFRLHCSNGVTIEMHRGGGFTPRPTRPTDLNTKVACAYDPAAKAPLTAWWFGQYQPDEDVRRYMLQMWAKGLSGQGVQNVLAHIGGDKTEGADRRGGNGKSTMMTAAGWVAGQYAVTLPIEVILRQRGRGTARQEFRSELCGLKGARLVTASEPGEGAVLAAETVCDLTGGADITARGMHRDSITFKPRILLTFTANNRPKWTANGGLERRWVEIGWRYEIPLAEQRESFMDELAVETSGFLNAILVHWMGSEKVSPPEAVRSMTDEGSKKASPVQPFIADALEKQEEEWLVKAMTMFEAYCEWARQNNVHPHSSTKFGLEMGRLGVHKAQDRTGTWYHGYKVREEYVPRSRGF